MTDKIINNIHIASIFDWQTTELKREMCQKIRDIREEYRQKMFKQIVNVCEDKMIGARAFHENWETGGCFIDDTLTIKEIVSEGEILCIRKDGTEALYDAKSLLIMCEQKDNTSIMVVK